VREQVSSTRCNCSGLSRPLSLCRTRVCGVRVGIIVAHGWFSPAPVLSGFEHFFHPPNLSCTANFHKRRGRKYLHLYPPDPAAGGSCRQDSHQLEGVYFVGSHTYMESLHRGLTMSTTCLHRRMGVWSQKNCAILYVARDHHQPIVHTEQIKAACAPIMHYLVHKLPSA